MLKIQDDILSYREMCDAENIQVLQRGMNFKLNNSYSVILMSQRNNAHYNDKIYEDGITIEYEGHDISRKKGVYFHNPKTEDQIEISSTGKLTQNGLFVRSIVDYKNNQKLPELVKVYEKILPGIWSLKGYFDLLDYKKIYNEGRYVYRFILRLSERQINNSQKIDLAHTRLIPSEVKKEVWKRDHGKCVICGEVKNLHFDHELPFSKGGTSLSVHNVRLLCMSCNLKKSDKIE